MSFVRACAVTDLEDAKPLAVTVGDTNVAIVKQGEDFYAIYDECSHAAIPLSEGDVEGCLIECWLHGSTFDLRTGRPLALPATRPVPVFPLTIDGDRVLVDVDTTVTVNA